MRCPVAKTLGTVVLLGVCSAQIQPPPTSPSHYFEIKLPDGVASESILVRYVLDSDDFGDWVQSHSGVSSYLIDTTRAGHPATRMRAVLYAPGCAIQTLDLSLVRLDSQHDSFRCESLSNVPIVGTLTRTNRLFGHDVRVQAKYVARWAQAFLGVADIPTIPVGDVAQVASNGSFRLSVPDFSQDPLAGVPDYPGELQIWATDRTRDKVIAQLTPVVNSASKTRMGGLRIRSEYPETVFAPCAANPPLMRDAFGFALRPDASDACDR
jgi:hypothetical protein